MSTSNVSTNYGFNFTDTGIQIADASTIANALMQLFVNAFALQNKQLNTSLQTPQGQLVTSLAAIINNKNIDLLTLANNLDINKSTGIWLDMLVKLWGLERKTSTPTIVTCTVTGLAGTTITEGVSQAQDTEGNVYVATSTVNIGSNGTATVDFQNIKGGAIGCVANTLTTILTTTSGWDTITNPSAGVIGSDAENDAELRARFKELVANNASGTLSALKSGILMLDDVLDCAAAENTGSVAITVGGYIIQPNRYALSILGGSDTDIAEAIYKKKSAALQNGNTTVSYTDPDLNQTYSFDIVRPSELKYFFNISLVNNADLPTNIVDLVKQAVYNNFYGLNGIVSRVHINSTTYANRFVSPINDIQSGIEIVSITMASQATGGSISEYGTSVTCGFAQYPSLDLENINVTVS